MNVPVMTASQEILCQVIKDVMGLDFDASNSEDVALAAGLVEKLMNDQQLARELADSIARYSRPAPPDQVSIAQRYRNVELKKVDAPVEENDFLDDDYASESSAEIKARQLTSEPKTSDSLHEWLWPTWAEINKSYVTISPEALGFHPVSTHVEWSNEVEDRWQNFLRTAEEKVVSRSDYMRWFRSRSLKKLAASTKQAAKNYSVLNLEVGEQKSAAYFLFDPSTLYVVVIPHHGKESRFEVAVDDTENLAKKLVNAFEGHADYAKLALNSMSKVFAH